MGRAMGTSSGHQASSFRSSGHTYTPPTGTSSEGRAGAATNNTNNLIVGEGFLTIGAESSKSKVSRAAEKVSDVGKSTLGYALQRMAEAANVSVPQIMFAQIPNLQSYLGNNFYEFRTRLSDADTKRFDRFLTMFGYAVSEPLTEECFTGRKYFNYVKADGVNISVRDPGINLAMKRLVTEQLEEGVRIWHQMPTDQAFEENPIVGE